MAYITTEDMKKKRDELKAQFPAKEGWKLSITRKHHSTINVYIMEAPIDFLKYYENNCRLHNHNKNTPRSIQQMDSIINSGNHDNSDIMTDYFDVGWYAYIHIGKWDKDFKFNNMINN